MKEPPKKPGKKLKMSSWFTSAPIFHEWPPRIQVTVSATCQRLMVVSRGEKLLRPKVRMRWPPWLRTTSGSLVLASPGSPSRAYCARSSLKNVELKTEDSEPLTVRVRTSEFPLCSTELVAPLFSKFWPVKFWWL